MSVSTCAIIPYGRRYEIERIHYDGPTRIEAVERLLPGPNFEQDTRHDSDQAWVEAEEQCQDSYPKNSADQKNPNCFCFLMISSSSRGIPSNIFICLIFYVSWDVFSRISFTLSMIALWLLCSISDPTDHFPLEGEWLTFSFR